MVEPFIILYQINKEKGWRHTRVMYDYEEENNWYAHNRNRVDGLSIAISVKAFNENIKDPKYVAYLKGEIDSYELPN